MYGQFKYLFSPLRIGKVIVPNRISFSAHLTNLAENNLPSERQVYYLTERAKGGAGLIITEEQSVHPTDHAWEKIIDAYNPEVIPGYRRICLVIGPEHDAVREYYGRTLQPRRIGIEFAVQAEPLGTADAVAAARDFADSEDFVVLNSDNYYPTESLAALRDLDTPGLPGFQREGLLNGSNIPPERIYKFAVIQTDAEGFLQRIVEKPDAKTLATFLPPICVSMNVFRFSAAIFEACERIEPSARGELELPDAVRYAMEHLHQRFRVLPFNAPVLDLSSRDDVEPVAQKLAGIEVNL